MRNVNLNILKFLESINNFCLSLINRGSPNEKIFTPTDERGFFPYTPHPTPHTPHPTPHTPHPTEKAPAIDRPDRWSGIWVRVVKDTDYSPFQTNNYDEHQ
ncbi:hypothetical protein OA58_15760 [Microcystis aeruginosa NIES-88]|nr:hypothetical protein OA58_15760 [Microcystis aeruginosa NIES-88]